ncbi:N-acetylglucosamine-6-phosphate deacetylase [Brucellaceae bacterium C25G]
MTDILYGIDPATQNSLKISVQDGIILSIEIDDNAKASFQDNKRGAVPYISAGLIDLQVNGYAGLDLNSGELTTETVIALCHKLCKLGVTSWLPTLITASKNSIIAALEIIAEARQTDWLAGQMIAGVHVEGPSISPLDGPRGAHPLQHVRAPSLDEFNEWQKASNNLVTLVTIAPEQLGAIDYIKALSAQNIIISIGHSAASPDDIHKAIEAGASMSTHLGNGVASSLPRHPNLIWAQLASDKLSAGFIADGWHLSPDTFKAMLRSRGFERSFLVSDSVALAGMPAGRYEQAIGGTVEVSESGRIGVADTPYLAGAGLPLAANVPIAMQMTGLSLADALQLASVHPGRFINGRGKMQVGERADLISFHYQPHMKELNIEAVWVAGKRIV